MAKLEYNDLLEAGVHFGHLTRKWDPRMAPFIFMERNGIHVIDLNKTLTSLNGQQGQTGANLAWSSEDHLAELADMSVPCLVLAAEHDAFFPPANLKRVAETIPDARYVEIPGSAHITTDPAGAKVISDAVSEFLSEQ